MSSLYGTLVQRELTAPMVVANQHAQQHNSTNLNCTCTVTAIDTQYLTPCHVNTVEPHLTDTPEQRAPTI